MSKFHLRLRELRNSRKLSQQELANLLEISKSSINMYERGEREPGLDALEAMADFFNVDMDYLMGKTSEIKIFDDKFDTKKLSSESQAYDIIGKVFGSQTAELVHLFDSFNEEGKEKLLDTAQDMSQLERYKKIYQIKKAARNGSFEEKSITDSELDKIKNLPDVDDLE